MQYHVVGAEASVNLVTRIYICNRVDVCQRSYSRPSLPFDNQETAESNQMPSPSFPVVGANLTSFVNPSLPISRTLTMDPQTLARHASRRTVWPATTDTGHIRNVPTIPSEPLSPGYMQQYNGAPWGNASSPSNQATAPQLSAPTSLTQYLQMLQQMDETPMGYLHPSTGCTWLDLYFFQVRLRL